MSGVDDVVQRNKMKRGLAVVIYNTYNDTKDYGYKYTYPPLEGTVYDGKEVQQTFKDLNFAVLLLNDASKADIIGTVTALASYSSYPKSYDCFVIYFAGHGTENSIIVADDGEEFNFVDEIICRLNKQEFPGAVLDGVTKASILIFIDACRGDKSRETRKKFDDSKVPKNMLLAYSTREGYTAKDINSWSQTLCKKLQSSYESVCVLVAEANDEVKGQEPIYSNTTVTIALRKKPPAVTNVPVKPAVVTDGDVPAVESGANNSNVDSYDENIQPYVKILSFGARSFLKKKLDWDNDIGTDLNKIAHHMIDWEKISSLLELTNVDIHDIRGYNGGRQRREALICWKNYRKENATYENLLKVFVIGHQARCADAVCEALEDRCQ